MEIKLRAWNKIDKVMITDLNSPYVHHGILVSDSNDILMPFTGLQDKSGKDIYEGDLILHPEGFYLEVKYMAPSWRVCATGGGYGSEILPFNIEVAGNIYENSELSGFK